MEKLGDGKDDLLEKLFYWWGKGCDSYNWIVLFLGICVIVGLGNGIKYIKVKKENVEIWD